MEEELKLYGRVLDSRQLQKTLAHVFDANFKLEEKGGHPTPVCIWGTHGLGKTTLVQEIINENGWEEKFVAPAQLEEMGDLHGMPSIKDPTPEAPHSGDEETVFIPPKWVPQKEGPGILLIDDINRADDRILRGMMQLLQNFELFASWKLPKKWQIVCTANPEGGDYSITPMDAAMLTRMLHFTMKFEPGPWAQWAQKQGIRREAIDFVITYPDLVEGERTTPRSLTQFFWQIQDIEDLSDPEHLDLLESLGKATLEDEATYQFLNYVKEGCPSFLTPVQLLGTKDFDKVADILRADVCPGGEWIPDRLFQFWDNVVRELWSWEAEPYLYPNMKAFLCLEWLESEYRQSFYHDLQGLVDDLPKKIRKAITSVLEDKDVSLLITGKD